MKVLSHRGWWKDPQERNSKQAFVRSFEAGFGTETDVRDICGKLVISHDMPSGNEITFEDVMKIMAGRNLPLAINIKADGLIKPLLELLHKYGHTNYFTFDMSIPDLVVQLSYKANVYTGLSDILSKPVLLEKCNGVWLDAFFSEWYDSKIICELIDSGKDVCIVSSDLHKRDPLPQWKMLAQCPYVTSDRIMLCTDLPDEAKGFFG